MQYVLNMSCFKSDFMLIGLKNNSSVFCVVNVELHFLTLKLL